MYTADIMTNAFIPHSPIADIFRKPTASSAGVNPARRERHAQVPLARSLDSYRSGSRFEKKTRPATPSIDPRHSPSNQKAASPVAPPPSLKPKKTTVQLVRALSSLNVASAETCAFLVRCGCVRVNGVVEMDDKARVHCSEDQLLVNGKEVGTVDAASSQPDDTDQRIPRAHRDRSPEDIDALPRGFHRGTDAGFFSSKKRMSNR